VGQVYAAGIAIVARNDCDIGNGGSVSQREEGKQNGEGEQGYPIIFLLALGDNKRTPISDRRKET